jgi:predicted ArsR family transcriptional regulator
MSCCVGAGTRMPRQRERTGSMTFDGDVATRISRHVAENEYEQKLNKALDIIRKHGPMTERDMIRRGFRLPERERKEILGTLEAGRMVVAVQVAHSGAGRPTIRYAATKDVPAGTHDAEIGED